MSEDIVRALKNYAPFNVLDDRMLQNLAASVQVRAIKRVFRCSGRDKKVIMPFF